MQEAKPRRVIIYQTSDDKLPYDFGFAEIVEGS